MILSKASVVRSPSRFGAWLRHVAAALAVVALASGTASAQYENYQHLENLTVYNSGFNPPPTGVDGVYATVEGLATPNGTTSTTVNFLVSATVDTNDISSFAFNTSVTDVLNKSDFNVYAISDTDGSLISLNEQVGLEKNVSEAGVFTYRLNFSNNDTQQVLISFTVAGTQDLSKFDLPNADGFTFAAHLKVPGISTGFVYGPGPNEVPEPASIAMLGFSSLVGLGYAWRRRGRVVA